MRNTHTSHAVKIGGELVNVAFARIAYRCAECLGELTRRDAGLVCASDDNHRGFIKQAKAAEIKLERIKQLTKIEDTYKIVDGEIVARGDN